MKERQGRALFSVGKFDEAIAKFEEIGMEKRANDVRRVKNAHLSPPQKPDVSNDELLERIIDIVRRLKLELNYICPRCGNSLKINKKTSIDIIKQCAKCGLENDIRKDPQLADMLLQSLQTKSR